MGGECRMLYVGAGTIPGVATLGAAGGCIRNPSFRKSTIISCSCLKQADVFRNRSVRPPRSSGLDAPLSCWPQQSLAPYPLAKSCTRLHASTSQKDTLAEEEALVEECEVVLGTDVEIGEEVVEGEEGIKGFLIRPLKNANGSGILLLSDILGFENEDTRQFAYRLGCFGYSVLVPDLFRGDPWEPSRPKSEYEAWRGEQEDERVAEDVDTAAQFLAVVLQKQAWEVEEAKKEQEEGEVEQGDGEGKKEAHPGKSKIALIGFCYGGGRLVEALARDGERQAHGVGGQEEASQRSLLDSLVPGGPCFDAAVFFYGTRFDPSLGAKFRQDLPLLLVAGDSDDLCPMDTVQALAKEVPGSVTRVYAGRGHAFAHHPESMDEDEDAEDAFKTTLSWLHSNLLEGAHGPWTES